MASVNLRSTQLCDSGAFHLMRRGQANIAMHRHFEDGDLARFLERDSFNVIAERLTDKFFHKSEGLVLHELVKAIYLVMLILAPIIQMLPLSAKMDWHRGHFLSWYRTNATNVRKRFHCRVRTVERTFQPAQLAANLAQLGIHDAVMLPVILDLYKRHYGGATLKDTLAHQLFDPIMLLNGKIGYELRHGNSLCRLERHPFDGSFDLRSTSFTVLDYSLISREDKTGRHLETTICDGTLADFRTVVKGILNSTSSPEYKVARIEQSIRDLVERTRYARTALPQLMELKTWLANKLSGLAATRAAANQLPNLLVNLWLQRTDSRMFLKKPTFFLDPSEIEEKTYLNFFSPYREV